MKDFKFNLDPILEDRERREQEKALDLANARRDMEDARATTPRWMCSRAPAGSGTRSWGGM